MQVGTEEEEVMFSWKTASFPRRNLCEKPMAVGQWPVVETTPSTPPPPSTPLCTDKDIMGTLGSEATGWNHLLSVKHQAAAVTQQFQR